MSNTSFVLKIAGKQQDPKEHNHLGVWISSGGVGVFGVTGWGSKSSVCPSKPRETKLFGGISGDFCRDIPGLPKKLETRSLCSIFGP